MSCLPGSPVWSPSRRVPRPRDRPGRNPPCTARSARAFPESRSAPARPDRECRFISTPSRDQVCQPVHTRSVGRWRKLPPGREAARRRPMAQRLNGQPHSPSVTARLERASHGQNRSPILLGSNPNRSPRANPIDRHQEVSSCPSLLPFVCPARVVVLRNRTVLAAMTNKQSAEDGTLSAAEIRWLAHRAAGGFGIVTTAATHVTPGGKSWSGEMGVWSDHHLPGLTELASAIRAEGAGESGPDLPRRPPGSPGMHRPTTRVGQRCAGRRANRSARALSDSEVEALVDAFVEAAIRCARPDSTAWSSMVPTATSSANPWARRPTAAPTVGAETCPDAHAFCRPSSPESAPRPLRTS